MGSLMSGWDSHPPHPNAVKLSRNKSLTKDGIEAYWKSKKQSEDEHLRDISLLSPRTQKIIFEEAIERSEGATTVPLDMHSETSLEKIIQKNGWWINCNSAFLNEPPVLAPETTAHKYTSQFHVADVAGSKASHGPAGINA